MSEQNTATTAGRSFPELDLTSYNLLRIIRDLGAGPIHGADEFAADYSVAVDDIGFRPAEGAVELLALLARRAP